MIASAPAIEPATLTLPVKMKLSTNVSILPVTLQLTALTIDRKWESRTRMNIGSSRLRRRMKSRGLRATGATILTSDATSQPAGGSRGFGWPCRALFLN
jgi:hypothetical protein